MLTINAATLRHSQPCITSMTMIIAYSFTNYTRTSLRRTRHSSKQSLNDPIQNSAHSCYDLMCSSTSPVTMGVQKRMNEFGSGPLAYILSSKLDNLIKLSFCLRADVLVRWMLIEYMAYIGNFMRIALHQRLPVKCSSIREHMANLRLVYV